MKKFVSFWDFYFDRPHIWKLSLKHKRKDNRIYEKNKNIASFPNTRIAFPADIRRGKRQRKKARQKNIGDRKSVV